METLPEFHTLGAGEPVVLLHGIGSGAESWRPLMERLADRFQLFAWNAPGYGASPELEDPTPGPSAYAAVLHHWLQMLTPPVHLVGHSLGALMAGRLAAEHPEQVRTLTLMSPAVGHLRLPESVRQQKLQARLQDLETLGPAGLAAKRGPRLLSASARPEAVDAVVRVMARVRPRGYTQATHLLAQGDLEADLRRLPETVPVQFMMGAEDRITPPETVQPVAQVRPDAPVTLIPQAGHAVYLEAPVAVEQQLIAFWRH